MSCILKQFNIDMKTKIYREESKRLVMTHGYDWKHVDDVKTVYTPVFGVPQVISYTCILYQQKRVH